MIREDIGVAIRAKHVIQFRYKDELRTVEPHTLGVRKGELELCAWQTSGTKPGFRDFRVGKVSGLLVTDRSFAGPRPGYNRNDSTMDQIIYRL